MIEAFILTANIISRAAVPSIRSDPPSPIPIGTLATLAVLPSPQDSSAGGS